MSWHHGIGILVARKMDGETQAELAERLHRVTDDHTWSASKVGRVERGETSLTPEELREVARCQFRSYSWYIDGPTPQEMARVSEPDEEYDPGRVFRARTAWPATA